MSDDSTKKKVWWIITIVIVVVGIGFYLMPSASASCGDYDRAEGPDRPSSEFLEKGNDGHDYEHDVDDGDYRKTGPGEFEYVGCSDSSGSGGGLFRGGGPGVGK